MTHESIIKAIIATTKGQLKDPITGEVLRSVSVGNIVAEDIYNALIDAGYKIVRDDV